MGRLFVAGTRTAKDQGLYGAGQDLLKDAFSGNVRGMGPAAAEMEFEERPAEPFLFFAADKTDPGAFNLPLYLAFADPMNTPGLMLAPSMGKGFRFVIMDVNHTEGDRVIELNAPEELYEIAALLRDTERYVVESIWSLATDEQAVAASTSRLHNIAGKYTGKDDPVMLVRVQQNFPATGEVLAPYAIGHLAAGSRGEAPSETAAVAPMDAWLIAATCAHCRKSVRLGHWALVAGCMRGSHQIPLMPVPLMSGVSYFDGPPVISGAAFSMRGGKFTEPADVFAHPFWDTVRDRVADKAVATRRQGFFGAAMLPMSELEYTGIMEKLERLDTRFQIRRD